MTRSSTAIAIGAVLAGTTVGLLRQPGAGALDTLWAEDGAVFLGEATRQGALSAVGTSYAGYFHTVPRLVTAGVTLLPAGAAAAALAVAAALCIALLALLVFVASADMLRSTLARVLVSAPVVLVPVGQDEVLNSPANLHWYGLYALFWVLLWRPRTTAGRVVAVTVVALVAASDILVLAYLPLAVYRARQRERYPLVLAGALTAGLALQFLGLLTGASDRPLNLNPVTAVTGFVLRAVPAPLIGERWLGTEAGVRMVALAALAWLVVGAAVLVAVTRVSRPDWALAAGATVHAAALYALPVVLSGYATPRYAVAPALLVITALVALVQPRLDARGTATVPIYALTAVLAVVALANLRIANARADGPLWSTELADARNRCAVAAGGTVEVAISPAPTWSVRLPCAYLGRSASTAPR